jgi:tRNA(His) guanylyltransferase
MNPQQFETRMRALECFHALRVPPGVWPIVRVDGRSFTAFTESRGFEKPFDQAFRDWMVTTTQALFQELGALYAYTESDEISVLLPADSALFDREVEKLVSISAGIASGVLSCQAGVPVVFDSRVCLAANADLVVDYFRWRQADAGRCALNGWAYWTLRRAGKSARDATTILHGQSVGFKHELLFQQGINFNDLPLWQRRGIGVYWETYQKVGYNPITGMESPTLRRRIKVDYALPMQEEYAHMIQHLLDTILQPGQ